MVGSPPVIMSVSESFKSLRTSSSSGSGVVLCSVESAQKMQFELHLLLSFTIWAIVYQLSHQKSSYYFTFALKLTSMLFFGSGLVSVSNLKEAFAIAIYLSIFGIL